MAKKKYYAVAVGRKTGIFTQWFGDRGAEGSVRGYPGAVYKGFATEAEARAFIADHKGRKIAPRPAARREPASRSKVKSGPGEKAPTDNGRIVVYTDGGALSNPGPGGYGAVIVNGSSTKELSRGYRLTTNNRMELLACIAGLSELKTSSAVVLYSDSRYVVNGISKGWARKWRANGWVKSNREPALNPDLWEKLLQLCEKHDVEFRWVKGHAGNAGNERCDELATRAAMGPGKSVDRGYEKTL